MAGFSLSLSGDDGDALRGYWEKLSGGGTTTMPLQKQAWGDEFGMCLDQFGVPWMVNIAQPQAERPLAAGRRPGPQCRQAAPPVS